MRSNVTSYQTTLEEERFGYDPKAYKTWGEDLSFVRACLEVTTTLGCDISRYEKQSPRAMGYQHFPEVEEARRLIGTGIPPACILYENYYLSAGALRTVGAGGEKVTGTRLLQRALAPRFFELFDNLYLKNAACWISPATKKPIAAASLQVDLFVLDERQSTVSFVEVKKISPGKMQHEGLKDHQKACLAILRYLFEQRRNEVFRDPAWSGRARLAVYVPRDGLSTHRYPPRSHPASVQI